MWFRFQVEELHLKTLPGKASRHFFPRFRPILWKKGQTIPYLPPHDNTVFRIMSIVVSFLFPVFFGSLTWLKSVCGQNQPKPSKTTHTNTLSLVNSTKNKTGFLLEITKAKDLLAHFWRFTQYDGVFRISSPNTGKKFFPFVFPQKTTIVLSMRNKTTKTGAFPNWDAPANIYGKGCRFTSWYPV